jgi:hypothetical protein
MKKMFEPLSIALRSLFSASLLEGEDAHAIQPGVVGGLVTHGLFRPHVRLLFARGRTTFTGLKEKHEDDSRITRNKAAASPEGFFGIFSDSRRQTDKKRTKTQNPGTMETRDHDTFECSEQASRSLENFALVGMLAVGHPSFTIQKDMPEKHGILR